MSNYTIQHISKDTYNGAIITIVDEGLENITLVGASLRMQFRLNTKTGNLALTLADGNGLTITGEKTFEIDKQIIPLDAGVYFSDIEVTLATGEIYTPIEIKWMIKQDITV